MANQTIQTQLYNKVTTIGVDNVTIAVNAQAINNGNNQMVVDLDTSAGAATLLLPAISDLLYESPNGIGIGGGATTFRIRGNIVANGGVVPNGVTLAAHNVEGNQDKICGDTNVTLNGVGTCFELSIAGVHQWMLTTCSPSTQS